jgi:transcription elongation factor Elf1
MAKVTRELLVCDVCGAEDDVAAVTVAIDGAEQTVELCASHRQQLRDAVAGVLGAAGKGAEGESVRRGRKAATPTVAARERAESRGRRMPTATCPHCGRELGVQNLGRHIAAKHPESV